MKLNKTSLILSGIVVLALFFRIHHLSSVPPSVSLDEASIGWNAYSVLTTGGDEYGYKSPILLRAYDDWRPALYVYLVMPFVKLLGLNILAVRLPSIILGTLAILTTYFLVKELFPKYRYKEYLGLLSTFFLAISPWSIYISRLGHEANAGFAFGIIAIFCFLKFVKTLKNVYLYFAAIFFSLSFYSYQAEKLFIPLIVALLVIIFREKILRRKKSIIVAAIIIIAMLLPILRETLSENGLARFRGTNTFDVDQREYVNASRERLIAQQDGDLIREVINNNRIISIQIVFINYISHFNPWWLFTNSGADHFKSPGMGLLYLFEFPLILAGLIYLFRGSFDKKTKLFLLGWVIASPVAASFTTETPHAMRSYNFLPTFQILSSLGLLYLTLIIKNNIIRKLFMFLFAFIIVANLFYFCRQYFIVFPKEQSSSFQYAMSKATFFVLENDKDYNKIVFSNTDNLHQSYMLFLFYSKYDPLLYHKQGGTKSGGYSQGHLFGKYEFRPVDPKRMEEDTLYIENAYKFPNESGRIAEFKDLDGAISVVAVHKK